MNVHKLSLKKITCLILSASGLTLSGCGSAETTTAETEIGVTSLSLLPSLSGEVAGDAAAATFKKNSSRLDRATTGTAVADFGSVTWTATGKSRPLCRVGEMTSRLIGDAVSPDRIKCYVGTMQKHSLFTDLGASDRFVKYELVSQEGDPMKVKFKVDKSATGKFQGFEMFTCQSGSQDEYINYKFAQDGSLAVTAVRNHSKTQGGATFNGGGRITVTGVPNSSGSWKSKSATSYNKHSFSMSGNSNSHIQKIMITQGAESSTLQGYMTSSGTWNTHSYNQSASVAGVFEMFMKDGVSSLAFGDGSAKGLFNGMTTAEVKSWEGDTQNALATAADGDFYAEADALALLESSVIDDIDTQIAFAESETWDCDTTEKTGEIDLVAEMTSNTAFATDFAACEEIRDPLENSQNLECEARQ